MAEAKELKFGDPCPTCGGTLDKNLGQAPERLIDHHNRNADKPEAAARYAAQVHAKADEFGVIHTCRTCGYSARFKAA